MRRKWGFRSGQRTIRLLVAIITVGIATSTSTWDNARAASGRDPAEVIAWVEARIPEVWRPLIVPVSWHVGNLSRPGAAMEADCSGGDSDGPLIGFDKRVYSQHTDEYWQQATAHEFGHIALCTLFVADSLAFNDWVSAAGPVSGAPNHVEMFAQCWARLVAGAAPPGYEFDCSDEGAWRATLNIAGIGPRAVPYVAETSSVAIGGPAPAVRIGNQRAATIDAAS